MKTLAREQDTAEILRRLRTVHIDSPRKWGRMSAHQMVCHLSDACRMALGRKPVEDASGLLSRTLLKWVALYLPVRWPPGIPTRPEIDQECTGTRPADFAADVAELEKLLTCFAMREATLSWPPHPFFGSLNRAAWLRWGYLHTDHHLRQFGA